MAGKMRVINPKFMGPIKQSLKGAEAMMNFFDNNEKHFLCNGKRALAIAVHILRKSEVIAVPTDTIYGLAAIMNDNIAVEHLYRIKKRDRHKPVAICLSSVREVSTYGIVDDIPYPVLTQLFPGKVTVILKRTEAVNPLLNPGIDNIGIRIPNTDFITGVAKIAGPLALTSANISDQPSTVNPKEFSELWPQLGGIFHDPINRTITDESRVGSTIVDLSEPGYFKINRYGSESSLIRKILIRNKFVQREDE